MSDFNDKYELELTVLWDGIVGIDICKVGAQGKYGGTMKLTPELQRFLHLADICYEEEQSHE